MEPLYKREGAYIPRIAAIHDLCGYGKCSLGVAIPVLSAAGCDVCPVPTGLFSSHTAFPGWYMHDTTGILHDYLEAWKGIGVDIDAVYSGFLGAPEQVDIIKSVYETYPKALRVVDPVMADNGKVYPTYTPELCQAMAELANGADILTPNLTEASIILGIDWPGADIDTDTVHRMIDGLREKGAKNVVLKGIEHGDGTIHNQRASALQAARHGRPVRVGLARRRHGRQGPGVRDPLCERLRSRCDEGHRPPARFPEPRRELRAPAGQDFRPARPEPRGLGRKAKRQAHREGKRALRRPLFARGCERPIGRDDAYAPEPSPSWRRSWAISSS